MRTIPILDTLSLTRVVRKKSRVKKESKFKRERARISVCFSLSGSRILIILIEAWTSCLNLVIDLLVVVTIEFKIVGWPSYQKPHQTRYRTILSSLSCRNLLTCTMSRRMTLLTWVCILMSQMWMSLWQKLSLRLSKEYLKSGMKQSKWSIKWRSEWSSTSSASTLAARVSLRRVATWEIILGSIQVRDPSLALYARRHSRRVEISVAISRMYTRCLEMLSLVTYYKRRAKPANLQFLSENGAFRSLWTKTKLACLRLRQSHSWISSLLQYLRLQQLRPALWRSISLAKAQLEQKSSRLIWTIQK